MTGLHYRLLHEDDLPGVERLWAQAGWSLDQPEEWRAWYLSRHPCGLPIVALALDEHEEVVAQLEFQPSRVHIGGEEAPALRISSAIVRPEFRAERLQDTGHPIPHLFRTGAAAGLRAGYRLLYAFPRSDWLPVLEWAAASGLCQFQVRQRPCCAVPIEKMPESASDSSDIVRFGNGLAAFAGAASAEHEALWRTATRSWPIDCGVIRDAHWLRVRTSTSHSTLVDVRDERSEQLVGYCVVRKRDGLILDLLAARTSDVEPVLGGASRWVARNRDRAVKTTVNRLTAMVIPSCEPALRALGFRDVAYSFLFSCCPLDETLPARTVSPERWYLAPGD